MLKKIDTQKVYENLRKSKDIETFIKEHNNDFVEEKGHAYLNDLLDNKGISKTMVIRDSNLDRVYGYQILSGKRRPSRNKLLQISLGLKFDLVETKNLIRYFGLSELYPKNRRDAIIIFSTEKKMGLDEAERLLEELGEEGIQDLI
ncbi:MAG: XRE family transcriptional regulator [Firmicutes bacterium]|jgi:DNA-binding phage protein|nr:XRE family transcriptional regulator [Bacillota bacterium]